jgi:hypothetical protein
LTSVSGAREGNVVPIRVFTPVAISQTPTQPSHPTTTFVSSPICSAQLSFTWLSFYAGTLSAVTSAAKAILSKKVLDGKPLGENLTPSNMFAVLTILGFLMILPVSLAVEGPKAVKVSARVWGFKRNH